jgi:hypothetical protein
VHAFVDESERPGRYLMCAVHVAPAQIHVVRPALTALCLPGQYRVHMTKERPSRRRLILDRIANLPLRAVVYTCAAPPNRARPACLRRMVADLVERSTTRLVIEPVESHVAADRFAIERTLEKAEPYRDVVYEHLAARLEPILWAADAIAWAYGIGGDWRRRVRGIVEREVFILP